MKRQDISLILLAELCEENMTNDHAFQWCICRFDGIALYVCCFSLNFEYRDYSISDIFCFFSRKSGKESPRALPPEHVLISSDIGDSSRSLLAFIAFKQIILFIHTVQINNFIYLQQRFITSVSLGKCVINSIGKND